MTWLWDWPGGETLAAFVMLAGMQDTSGMPPLMVEVARVQEQRWVDTLADPAPGECRYYNVAAEDLAGNRSE
jgi:hypothetical protein